MKFSLTVVIIAFGLCLSASVYAKGEKYEVINKEKIYYGDCTSFAAPATVALNEVFPHIHEYKLIGERKLNEKDPEYWVLLLQANEVFRDALKRVASTRKCDLVAERGAIKAISSDTTIPDVTHLIIAEVEHNPEDR